LIHSKIPIKVKTFHGSRKVHSLEIGIAESIDTLRRALVKEDKELEKYKHIRLAYTLVHLHCTCLGKIKGT